MERRRVRIFAAFGAVIAIIGWVIASGFKDTMVYYKTVPELRAIGQEADGRGFRVSGHVVPGSVVKSEDGLSIKFVIEEQGQQLPVSYHGIVPDTFKEDIDVLLEGKYANGQFAANQIFTKCASKYESEDGSGYSAPPSST